MNSFRNVALALAAALPLINAAPAPAEPVIHTRQATPIPGKYIVTLNPGAAVSELESHLAWVSDVHARSLARRDETGVEKTYNFSDFSGYSGNFDDATIEEIKLNPDVSKFLSRSRIHLLVSHLTSRVCHRLRLLRPIRSGASML